MAMTPRVRKFVLTTHVVTSVGWLGGVAVFLCLAIIAMTSRDDAVIRGTYLVLEPAGWYVLVPLSLASLLTGLIHSLGGSWGLFRHYWVVFKLVINVVATIVLLAYMLTLGHFAVIAADTDPSGPDLTALGGPSPAIHAGGALLLLLVAVVLSVYKPRGMTKYGARKQRAAVQPAGN